MSDERAELSSLATTLHDVLDRVTASAERLLPGDEQTAAQLFEVERSLRVAARRLDAAVRQRS